MKTKLFLIFMVALITFANAQKDDLVFFMKDGASGIHEAKCDELGELWVRVPIPSNIDEYDGFTVFVYLSTIDYNLRSPFDKEQISKKLVGKEYIDLFLLGPEGTKKTAFGDETVFNDLCKNPLNYGVKNFEVNVYTKAFNIIRYEKETYWDHARSSYITKERPIWDKGESFSESKFTIIQKSLSGKVTDSEKSISLKIPNPDNSTFSNSKPYSNVQLSYAEIEDNSTSDPITIEIFVHNGTKFPLNTLVEDFTSWANGKVINPNYNFRGIMYKYVKPTWRTSINPKEKAMKVMTDFTISNVSGKQFTWYQRAANDDETGSLRTGYYAKIYFFEGKGNTYIAIASMNDEMTDYPYKISYKITPEDAAKVDALILQVMESIEFLY